MEIVMLATSLLLNVFSFLYIRWLLKTLSSINEEVSTVYSMLTEYSNHLTSVHDLEMFYGDETLGSLMTHTRDLCTSFEELDLVLNEQQGPGEENEA